MGKKTYRGKLPKPDKRGYLRPEVGDCRFTLGHVRDISQGEATRRLQCLRDLFEKQCRYYRTSFWAASILPYAKKLAAGETLVFMVSDRARREDGQASEEVEAFELLKSLGLAVVPDDAAALARGEQFVKALIDQQVNTAVIKAVREVTGHWQGFLPAPLYERVRNDGPENPAEIETKTLHDGFRAYRTHIEATGKRQENGDLAPSPKNYMRWSNLLEQTHEDIPLWQIDHDKMDTLFAHWRNRPVSETTNKRISIDHAKHMMSCLWAVFVRLDESGEFKWKLPPAAHRIKKTPERVESDRHKQRSRRIAKSIYTPEQLAMIAQRLDRFGKLILGVCVNCAMQPAEIGRLEIQDYYTAHPETGVQVKWIIFDRPKTMEYGEWLLWNEVAELVEWGIERAKRIGAQRLIVNERGIPWYREDWANPYIRFAKWWQAQPSPSEKQKGVITKIRDKSPDFPRHTIKYLRKILPNMVRPKYGKEVADLVNARHVDKNGSVGGGETDRYADRLYDRVAEAIRDVEPEFRPFLDALRDEGT